MHLIAHISPSQNDRTLIEFPLPPRLVKRFCSSDGLRSADLLLPKLWQARGEDSLLWNTEYQGWDIVGIYQGGKR
jgi:hypothetical protein